MSRRVAVVLTLVACVLAPRALHGQENASRAAFRSGDYEAAIEYLEAELEAGRAGDEQARTLADALIEVGRYDDAIAAMQRYGSTSSEAPVANRLGRALVARGRLAQAAEAFERATAAAAPDALDAELNLAELEFASGRRRDAMARFGRFIDIYNGDRELDSDDLTAVGTACTYLGIDDPQLFHDAVRAFDEAIAADPGNPEPRLRLGELFLDKYDSGQAEDLLQEVLRGNPRHPRALLAEARRMQFDGSPEAMDTVQRALAENPSLVPGRVFLARLLLISEQRQAAVDEAERALTINPASLPALSVLAASRYLEGDQAAFESTVARALRLDPGYGDLYNVVAEMAVQNRLYAQAVAMARRAIELDPKSWAGHGTLGINELRLGHIEAGRRQLEVAFRGDPFNVWFKNTLDLLDTYPDYRTVASRHFDLFVEADIAESLALYMGPLADEALESLTARYGVEPQQRVRVEVYRRHADFSVRTVGLAGIGALGVAFGPVVAVDAPMTPSMGEFNWGSTLWHEIAHVVTLAASANRVPRWLTEGLSVFEERRARPGWGAEVTPEFMLAWLEGRLNPVSRINDGFVRPAYPGQVAHSYLQASLVCELIQEDHGFEAIRAMLAGYREGHDTVAIVRQVLGLSPEALDARFVEWFEERYAVQLSALRPAVARRAVATPERSALAGMRGDPVSTPELERRVRVQSDDFLAQLQLGARYYELGRDQEAIPHLEKAQELFPEHATDDSAYGFLARIREQRGDLPGAIAELRAMSARNEASLGSNLRLADLLQRSGDQDSAAAALQRAVYVNPFDAELHTRLAELRAQLREWDREVVERRAVVALQPVDRAAALYRLAQAQWHAGDADGARRSVLGALEIAPGYRAAQELLLRLHAARKETS